jgi:hypothetical protein
VPAAPNARNLPDSIKLIGFDGAAPAPRPPPAQAGSH